jgi:arylsulfatase A-like enzyme/Flp pilus assembly protein TadD
MFPPRLAPLLLLPLLLACGGERGTAGPLDVVVITLDTTRADALGAYGQPLPVTPRIDAMAAGGALFEQALASAPSTLPSHATLFTGLQPYAHGVRSNTGYRLSEANLTLAELLAARGWTTGAEVAAPVLASSRRLAQGFGVYHEPSISMAEAAEILQEQLMVRYSRPAEEISDGGIDFLRANADRPFFLWLHYFDAHAPHAAPEPFASRFDDDYLAEVSHVDHEVGRVLDEIEALGLRERTLVVLTADHGEGRGDHGEESHAYFVYDTVIRVPLLFLGAGIPAGTRIGAMVRLVDVTPTVLDLLGLPPLEGVQGVSLRPLLEDPDGDLRLTAYGETIEWRTFLGGDVLRFLREGRWKYMHKLEPALYDVEADPGEMHDRAREQPEVVERLREKLAELLAEAPAAPRGARSSVSAAEAEQLRALGYAAEAGPAAPDGALDDLALAGPDPARHTRDLSLLIHAMAELNAGNVAAAEPLYRRLRRMHPHSRYALAGLIHTVLEEGREDEGIELLRQGLEQEPAATGYHLELAKLLARRGRTQEAERLLREALAIDPCLDRARLQLSQLLRARGLQAERIAVLAEVAEGCPDRIVADNALAYALATVPDAELRDGQRALRLARAVVEQTRGEHPDYLDTLAAAYAELGDFDQAIAEQRRALTLVEGRDLPPRLVAYLEHHLASFEAGEPLRVP